MSDNRHIQPQFKHDPQCHSCRRLEEVETDLAALRADISKVLNILEASKLGAIVLKWFAAVGSGLAIVWFLIKDHYWK